MNHLRSDRNDRAWALLEGLAEEAQASSASEIREEIIASGGDPEKIAAEMRTMARELVQRSREDRRRQAHEADTVVKVSGGVKAHERFGYGSVSEWWSAIVTATTSFLKLGFFPGSEFRRVSLALGGDSDQTRRRIRWQIGSWMAVAAGILLGQLLPLASIPLRTNLKAIVAAGVLSLALVPLIMRWLNARRPRPGIVHLVIPFLFGLLSSFVVASLIQIALKFY